MNFSHSNKQRVSLLAVMFAIAFQASSEEAELANRDSSTSLDTFIHELVEAPWPLGFEFFRRVGGSDFKQQGSSNSDPIVFRSSPIETRDGYQIDYTEFRIRPRLIDGISFYYVRLAQERCYPTAALKKQYALEAFVYPPSPHNAAAERERKETAYELRSNGTVLHFTSDGSSQECLVSFYRSAR